MSLTFQKKRKKIQQWSISSICSVLSERGYQGKLLQQFFLNFQFTLSDWKTYSINGIFFFLFLMEGKSSFFRWHYNDVLWNLSNINLSILWKIIRKKEKVGVSIVMQSSDFYPFQLNFKCAWSELFFEENWCFFGNELCAVACGRILKGGEWWLQA